MTVCICVAPCGYMNYKRIIFSLSKSMLQTNIYLSIFLTFYLSIYKYIYLLSISQYATNKYLYINLSIFQNIPLLYIKRTQLSLSSNQFYRRINIFTPKKWAIELMIEYVKNITNEQI